MRSKENFAEMYPIGLILVKGRVSKGFNDLNTILGHFTVFLLTGSTDPNYGDKSKNQVK